MAQSFDIPRYCGRCGEIFDGRETTCPECGGQWPKELPHDLVATYALLLTELHNLRRRGDITDAAFRSMRRIYEDRLIAVRPARKPKPEPEPAAPSTPAPPPHRDPFAAAPAAPVFAVPTSPAIPPTPVTPVVPRPATHERAPAIPPAPPRPPRDLTGDLRNWAARRQADLVLYLGAFLLTISALIFVSYQGSGMSGLAKSGLFAAYTLFFLVLGMQLGKWKRVREAGPVFVALAAVLTPLNFIALYTNVLRHEEVAQEYVWLAGSAATAGLYSLLALQGYGRLYWLPAGGAYFAAYASLGACLQLPPEWFGPWFMGLAVAANVVAGRVPARFAGYVEGGAYALGAVSLLFTHESVAFEGGAHTTLPVAYALATAGLARSAFPARRAGFLGVMPGTAVMTVASGAWSVDAWADNVISWAPAWLLAGSAAYLVVARLKPALAPVWASLSLMIGAAAVGLAHIVVVDGDIPWRLPVAYALAAGIATAWYYEQKFVQALPLVPALVAAYAASSFWAAGSLAFEWLGSFVAAAGIGYVLLARVRPAYEGTGWRMLAAFAAAFALTISHFAASFADINRWELAAAYGLVAGGSTVDALRYRPAALVSVFALAFGGAAALWAFDAGFAWWAAPSLAIALAIVATEKLWDRDATLKILAWPSVVILAASPIALVSAYIDEPWVGAASFAVTALCMFALALRTNGAFSALAGRTSQRAARLERQMFSRLGAWALFAAGGFVDIALGLSAVESAWTYAVAGAALWLAVAALRWRISSLDEVLGPVGLSAFVVAVVLGRESSDHCALMLGVGTVAAALAAGGRYRQGWRAAYALGAVLSLGFAHLHASDVGTDAWQLPAAYGLVLAALLWDSAWNRFQPAMLFVPAVVTAGSIATVWWREWPEQHMAWTPLALSLGIAATKQLWMRGAIVRKGAYPYVLVLALAPIALVGVYEDSPWSGVAGFALATTAWIAATLRSRGALASLIGLRTPEAAHHEQQVLTAGAFGLGLATIASTVYALGQPQIYGAWASAGASIASWMAILALRKRLAAFEEVVGPASLSGIAVAVAASLPQTDHTAMILGVTSVAAALTVGGRFALAWRLAYVAAAAGSIVYAHNYVEEIGRETWQLPAAYGLALVALLWDSAWNRYQPAMLGVPPVAAAGATAFAWWQEWPYQHWVWAPLGIALAIAATEKLWSRGAIVRKGAWWYVLGLGLGPTLLLETYSEEAWSGAAAFTLAAIAWAAAAWRSNGALGELFELRTAVPPRAERRGVALGSYGLVLVALAHLNLALELSLPQSAWTFAATGAAAIFATCIPDARVRDWLGTLTAAGVTGLGIGFACALGHSGELAAMAGLAGAAFVASGLANRSEPRVVLGAILAVVSGALLWDWADWPAWSLSLAYAGVAVALFAGLAPLRKSRAFLPGAVGFLSTAPIVLAVALAVFSVMARNTDQQLAFFDQPADEVALVRTPEWASMAINVVLAGLMLVAEGFYRTGRRMVVAGSAVLLVGVELATAMLQVDNIQVYTSPLAVYLIGLGLSIRRSEPLFSHHMLIHEALFVAGAAILVLPPAEQSFEPGGANWGLLVILEGMALLAVGLSLFQRWLAVAGVVTLVAVAGRFVFDNTANGNIPYWAMLGVAGLALLGVGVLMLLERDWWDRTKARMARWWLESEHLEPPGGPTVTPSI